MGIRLVTNEGRNVFQAVDQVRTLCKEIGLLLRTAETQFARHGWICTNKSAAAGLSRSIESPEKWVPESVHRFMENGRFKGVLAFVAVILEDPHPSARIEEPLVSGGWIEFAQTEFWYADMSRWHLYNPKRSDDGRANEFRPGGGFDARAQEGVARACTLGVPLVSITNADGLEQRIVAPLLSSLPGSSAGSAP